MPATFDSIAEINGDGSSSTISFTSIPAGFTDLQIHAYIVNSAGAFPYIRFNGDTGANYVQQSYYQFDSTNATSARNTTSGFYACGYQTSPQAGFPASSVVDIFDYRRADVTGVQIIGGTRTGAVNGEVALQGGWWKNPSAAPVVSIQFTNVSAQPFSTNTKITLYGILRA